MRNKKIIIPIIVMIILITILSSFRIYNLNKDYPNPVVIEHSLNEKIDGGNISLTVLDSSMVYNSYIKQLFPEYVDYTENSDGTKVTDEQIRVLLIKTKLTNNSDAEQKFSLVQMNAESLIWANGIDGGLYPLLNPDNNNPMGVTIPPNKDIEVILPYTIYDLQFQKKDWEEIDNRHFDLAISYYPVKHIVNLM